MVARLNFVAQDRPDVQYATKEVCREMSAPTVGGLRKLKRLARYLKGKPRVRLRYKKKEQFDEVTCVVDADYGGCSATRRSTSGGVVRCGSHCVKTWSVTQPVVAVDRRGGVLRRGEGRRSGPGCGKYDAGPWRASERSVARGFLCRERSGGEEGAW